jgi:hypothetical protein
MNKIYHISFDYAYALADVKASLHGKDSMELCSERPELINEFLYDWVTNESENIPDFCIIMTELLGCKAEVLDNIKGLLTSITTVNIKIGICDYSIFINVPTIKDALNIKKSKVSRFADGDIMSVDEPVFLPNKYPMLFKIEEQPGTYYCTEDFKAYMDSSEYTGLLFSECNVKSKSWF